MPSRKRIKLSSTPQSSTAAAQRVGIKAFTRTRKVGLANVSAKKPLLDPATVSEAEVQDEVNKSKKRKRSPEDGIQLDDGDRFLIGERATIKRSNPDSAHFEATCPSLESSLKKGTVHSLPTPETTPTKLSRRRDLLQTPTPTKGPTIHSAFPDTPPSSPRPNEAYCRGECCVDSLPPELQNLIQLHASFLKALSLHFAHHGKTSPIDITVLIPSISRIWGRRTVTLEDLRRSLGVQCDCTAATKGDDGELKLLLFDYGRGKICIERFETQKAHSVIARHIDEDTLIANFHSALQRSWQQWIEDTNFCELTEDSATSFISQLPLATIRAHPSLPKVAPLFAEGHRRLHTLKSLAKTSWQTTNSISTDLFSHQPRDPSAVKSRNAHLLSRLQLKAISTQSTLKLSPTKAALARTAALHRLPHVIAMLSLFCPLSGKSRQTYSMGDLVRRIQDSSRSPLSGEEVERCLKLLAEEVVGGWVRILGTGGGIVGVVIDGGARPVDLEAWRRGALCIEGGDA